jgi:predicted small secreted protein
MNMKYLILVLSVVLGFALAGCEKEGPAEKASKKVDKVIEKAGEKVEEAGDKVKDATQ